MNCKGIFLQHSPECEESHDNKSDSKLDHQDGIDLKEGNLLWKSIA